MKPKTWQGKEPETCEVCGEKLVRSFIDGRTNFGPWAIMCESCFKKFGLGLGLGVGQVYLLKPAVK